MKKINLITFIFFLFHMTTGIQFSQFYVEQNSGVSVNLSSVSIDQSIQFVTYKKAWVCGNSGTILKTTNAGITWINITGHGVPDSVDLVNIFCVDSNFVLTAGKKVNTYVYRTTNGGTNWYQVFSQPSGFIHAIWMSNSNQGFMYGNPVNGRWSLWKTSNSGLNWDSSGLFLQSSGNEWGFNNALASRGSKIWFGTDNYRIYYSTNYGAGWQIQSIAEASCRSIWFYYIDSTLGFYGGDNASYKTANYGNNWVGMPLGPATGFTGIDFITDNVPPMQCWATVNNKIYYSNYNLYWTNYYQAPSGIYTHLGGTRVSSIYSWAVRDNGGITRIEFNPVAIKTVSSEIPNSFSLSQNYPNPFNPTTKIKYDISKNSNVELKLFDATGHQITLLVNEQQTPGTYEAEFDGSAYASGVYFYKLIVNGATEFTETKRMVLIK